MWVTISLVFAPQIIMTITLKGELFVCISFSFILCCFVSQMKRLGGRKNLWANKSSTKDDTNTSADRLDGRCFMPLNVAIQEPCSKGSLLDRIASLEDRLVHVRLYFCLQFHSFRSRKCSFCRLLHAYYLVEVYIVALLMTPRYISWSYANFRVLHPHHVPVSHC